MTLRWSLALAACTLACTTPAAPRVATARPEEATRRDVEAPVVVRWVARTGPTPLAGRRGAVDRLVLVARVEQPGALGLPLHVSVEAPEGVTQTRGPQQYVVAPAAPGSASETELEFEVTAVPPGDLWLVADAQGPSRGFHARVPYRFGRAAPVAAPPPLTASPVVINGTSAGPAVEMGGR